jgi:hypothetical protein
MLRPTDMLIFYAQVTWYQLVLTIILHTLEHRARLTEPYIILSTLDGRTQLTNPCTDNNIICPRC